MNFEGRALSGRVRQTLDLELAQKFADKYNTERQSELCKASGVGVADNEHARDFVKRWKLGRCVAYCGNGTDVDCRSHLNSKKSHLAKDFRHNICTDVPLTCPLYRHPD